MAGNGGTVVIPAPNRAARMRCDEEDSRRVIFEPVCRARADPMTVADSRLLAAVRLEAIGLLIGDSVPAGGWSAELPQTSQ
jgi:hypothetical protein